MKKTYIIPSLEIEKEETVLMLVASNPDVTYNSEETIEAGEVEARKSMPNLWDDEE